LQVFNTTENERQWVVDHLSHTMNIHQIHYRQSCDVIERVDIAKLLLIQDLGLVGKYKGKKLKDIQLNGKNNILYLHYMCILWSRMVKHMHCFPGGGINDQCYVFCLGQFNQNYLRL